MFRFLIFTGILIIQTMAFSVGDTLVFQNGNRMEVDELHIDEVHVVYTVRGMTVKIPIRYIDLDETMKIRQELDELRRKEEVEKRRLEEKRNEMYAPEPSMEELATRSFEDASVRQIIDKWRKRRESLNLPAAGPPSVEMPPENDTYNLPFWKQHGIILVSGVLNDRAKVSFIFDTGASYTTISEATARAVDVTVDSQYQVPIRTANGNTVAHCGVIRRLQLGELIIQNLDVLVLPQNDVNLLGQNFISLFEVGIDYSGMEIKLRRKSSAP
ncbi:MAG: clan AA aspartic protease [Acidobacteria bacterium]|nr:clan AA aspartic protease [Acidobacteriota bacterium]